MNGLVSPIDVVLDPDTRWRAVEFHAQLDSTNAEIRRRAAAGAAPGLVVCADHQTEGRGRRHVWRDHHGRSLLVSFLVRPDDSVLPLLPLATGVALHAALHALDATVHLVWPDEVRADDGRKLAGVLITAEEGTAAIGVGVDVDWRGLERTGEERSWTSLAEHVGRPVDRWELLGQLMYELDRHLRDAEEAPDQLRSAYHRACATLGTQVQVVRSDGTVVSGFADDLDEAGGLVILGADGTRTTVHSGEVNEAHPAPM